MALVERKDVVGGTCINTGTIPSKTMREAVLHLSGFQYQGIYGVNYRVKEKITMADLSFRVQQVIKNEIDVTQAQLSRNGITLLNGVASFVDPHDDQGRQSSNGEQRAGRDAFIIATGTRPAESADVPVNGRTIILSDQLMQMPDLPKTLIVVGGGVIGVEYTCMFAALGVRVVLVEKRPRLLEFADQEIVEALCYHLRDHRVTLRLGEEVETVEADRWRGRSPRCKSQKKISGDALLYAVGRTGQRRRAQPGGRRPGGRRARPHHGRRRVSDDSSRTSIAVGDVIGFPSLASVSMEQGRIAAGHAVGTPVGTRIPPAIRTASTRSRRSRSSARPRSS